MSMRDEMLLWMILIFCYILLAGSFPCDEEANIAFSGGYLSVDWERNEPNSTSFRKITFDFKPTYEVGVLFFIEFHLNGASAGNVSTLFSMLSYNGSLIFSIQPKGQPTLCKDSVISNHLSSNKLSLHIRNNILRIRVKKKWHTFPFEGDVDVRNLLFGGARDFTTYDRFPVRKYFVGTLTNLNIGQNCISVVKRNELTGGHAVVHDNCTQAVSSFVEFNALSRPLTSVTIQPTTHLRVNFTIVAKHCLGEILHLDGGSFMVALSASKLVTTIANSSGHSAVCMSNDVIDQSRWINVIITYTNDTIKYIINDMESGSCHIDLGTVNFTGTLTVGGSKNTSVSFIGYLRHLYWDNSEINLVGLAATEQQSCVGIGPVSCGSGGFNTRYPPSCPTCTLRDWGTFDVSVQSNLTVKENKKVTIGSDNFMFLHAGSQCLTDQDLQRLWDITFTMQKPNPVHGKLDHTSFTFENLNNDEVHYNHLGAEEESDVINLLVQIRCGNKILYKKEFVVYVHVSPVNDHPELHLNPVSMVIGTRRVITRNVIEMSDVDTPLQRVRCVQHKVGQNGAITGQFEWANKPGHTITGSFDQDDINADRIVLRLFLNATGKSKVVLTVSDGIVENYGNFDVDGFSNGKITLTTNKLEVVENRNVSIDKFHLVAGTNLVTSFGYQKSPVVSFILTSFPKYGELLLTHNESFMERNVSHFTQYHIHNGVLFYSHNVQVQNSTRDCFTFKLMVDDFEGGSDAFCVDILIEDHLPKLVLNMNMPQNITLLEGGEKLITNEDLNITSGLKLLNGQINASLPDDVIILILFIEPPKYGSLYLNNSIGNNRVVGGSNISLEQLMGSLLVYDHKEEEEHQDMFRIKIIAQNFSHLLIHSLPVSSMEYVVFVDITPINNKYPVIQIYKNLNVIEGLFVYLTTDIINITDADRPVENLTVYIIPKEVGSNGYFATRDNYSVAISKFSVNQMIEGQIVFKHHLGKELEEDYTLVVSDGLHNSSSEIRVVAKPVTLNVSAAHSIEECSLRLDLQEHNSVQIHDRLFSISLNSGNPPNVQVTATMDSGIYFNNSIDIYPITNFSKRDIDQGYIWYIVKDNKTRVSEQQFGLNFSIGHSEPVHVQFRVCFSLLPYPQLNTASNLNLLLSEGGDIEINSSLLFSTDTRNQTSLYHVWYELVVPPAYGQLMMRLDEMQADPPVKKFYQQDVDAGDIYYDNHNHSNSGDKFILTLSNQFYNHTTNITVSITIFLLELKVVNNGFTAREGGIHTILTNELYATGPHGYSVMFYIDTPPVHGSITLNTDRSKIVSNFSKEHLDNGLITYINGGEEFYQDSMKITIKATIGSVDTPPHIMNTTYSGIVHIRIELVNDNKPREWNVTDEEINIVDGDSFIFTSYNLSYQDDDADMDISLLEYTVVDRFKLEHGYLFFGPNKTVVTHFLQRDIFDLQIGYQSNKSFVANNDEKKDLCVLTVSDGKYSENVFLTFKIVPFIIVSKKNESLLLDEGGRVTLLDKNLLFVAAEAKPQANDSEYIYKITRQPMHGQLVMPDSCNCAFTQEELRNGSVAYEHDDSDTTKDSFTFVVIVRGFKTAVMTFVININPVDDEIPSVTYVDSLIVHFGQAVYFNRSVIEAVDNQAGLSDLVFNVEIAPMFGSMKRQKTGPRDNILNASSFTQLQVNEEAIFYKHEREADGEWIDNVTLSLTDGRNPYNKLIVITFILLPYDLPMQVNGITLLEGRIVRLTIQNFEVTHPYLSTLELYINVTESVEYGQLSVLGPLGQQSTDYFNSTEMDNNIILYYNEEDHEVIEDKFKFIAMAGGISSTEHTFVFTIMSENDETPVIVNNLMISLWAGEVKQISRDVLFANDSDAHPADELEYIIGTNTLLGHFALKGADHTPITKFSQNDLVTGAVVFRSTVINDTDVEINFTVTDGKHQVKSYMTLEITVLTITVSTQHVELAMGAVELISFSPHTNDIRVKREFHYHVLTPPKFGMIMDTVSGLKITNFMQEQISNKQIVYKHTALDWYETNDIVDFVVSTDLAEPVEVSLNVSIILKSSPTGYLAASGSLNVDEGGTVCLNDSILDASNILYKVWKNQSVALHKLDIQYIIDSHPSAGTLKSGNVSIGEYFEHSDMKSSSGVCYHHNGSETTSDYFSVTINISYNATDVWYSNSTAVPIPVHIKPLNDEDPYVTFVDNVCAYRAHNYTTIIHPEDMHIYDADTNDEELVVVINSQSEVVCSVTDVPTRNFTQSDINMGKVKCMSPPSIDSSNLIFYVTDGNNFSENKKNYTIHYHNVILTLSVTHNILELKYSHDRGLDGVTLTDKQLNSSATCNRGDTMYTVIVPPMYGNVTKLDHVGAVSNFTQLDIDDELIQYMATNKSSYNDMFTMKVTNKHAAAQQVTVHVTALAMMNVTRPDLLLPLVNRSLSLPIELFPLVNLTDTAFTVINDPLSYGYLKLESKKRSSHHQFSFHGSQLVDGKVLYVLDKNITNGVEVLALSVQPDGLQAGFAEVSFSFSVQPSPTPTAASPTAQPVESNRPSYHRGSGFTLVALVPIIGVPSFILMVVIILACFWYSQKLKEKKRCAAARGSSAICMGTPPFNLPTAHITMATTDIDHNSENSSYQSSNNSDEGISMALPPEDQAEDEGVAQREDHFWSRPVMDYTSQYHHPLTSAYLASGYGTPIPQHVHKLPILKNEEYWL